MFLNQLGEFKLKLIIFCNQVNFVNQESGSPDSFSEVSIQDIRPVNEKPAIGQSTLEKVEIEIPQHLRKVAATAGIHDDFRKHVVADSCKFISQTNVLRLISKNGEYTRKKVDLLKVSHINYLECEQKRSAPPDEAAKFVSV